MKLTLILYFESEKKH